MGAGQLRAPDAAQTALNMGLSLVAVGKGLIMNPDWVALSQARRHDEIHDALCWSRTSQLAIPDGLLKAIEDAPGWFPIKQMTAAA
jgi:2,4-dienoyl-CoA reductase (NADPH2)